MVISREMSVKDAYVFFEMSLKALKEGSPIKTPIFKTTQELQKTLAENAKIIRETLDSFLIKEKITEKDENGFPVITEESLKEKYHKLIEEKENEVILVDIHTTRGNSNFILPNGDRIRLLDYLEKAVALPATTFSVLMEYYIKD